MDSIVNGGGQIEAHRVILADRFRKPVHRFGSGSSSGCSALRGALTRLKKTRIACSWPAHWPICSWRAGIYRAANGRNVSATRPANRADSPIRRQTPELRRTVADEHIAMPHHPIHQPLAQTFLRSGIGTNPNLPSRLRSGRYRVITGPSATRGQHCNGATPRQLNKFARRCSSFVASPHRASNRRV